MNPVTITDVITEAPAPEYVLAATTCGWAADYPRFCEKTISRLTEFANGRIKVEECKQANGWIQVDVFVEKSVRDRQHQRFNDLMSKIDIHFPSPADGWRLAVEGVDPDGLTIIHFERGDRGCREQTRSQLVSDRDMFILDLANKIARFWID